MAQCAAADCDKAGTHPIELVIANQGAVTVRLCEEHHALVQTIPNYRLRLRREALGKAP